MESMNKNINVIPEQTNLWWISNIICFPKEIETLFTKTDKVDFSKVVKFGETIGNHSRNGLKI